MKKLFVIGDLHFSDSRPWDLESFSKFIDWFSKFDIKNKKEDSELLLLGDCTEHAVNNGRSIDLLTKFVEIALSKFDDLIVIGGNHDVKEDANGHFQYSTQYLANLGNVRLVYDEEVFTSKQGFIIKALPHKKTIQSLDDYYNNSLAADFYKAECDVFVGHIMILDKNCLYMGGIDIDKFAFKYAAFGHIHQRFGLNNKHYTGSIMPFRKSEQETSLPRCIKVYSKNNDSVSLEEVDLPTFRVYEKIDISKEKPLHKKHSTFETHIYELLNCNDKHIFESLKTDYYVMLGKNAIQDLKDLNAFNEQKNKSISASVFKNKLDAFQKMMKDSKYHFKRSTVKVLSNLLK